MQPFSSEIKATVYVIGCLENTAILVNLIISLSELVLSKICSPMYYAYIPELPNYSFSLSYAAFTYKGSEQ